MSYFNYKDESLDAAINEGLDALDPNDDEYLAKLNAIANLVGKRNEAVRNANDVSKMEQTERIAKKSRIRDYVKIGFGFLGGIIAAGVGILQFNKIQEFEGGDGIYLSSQGKRMAREKRRETDPSTFGHF